MSRTHPSRHGGRHELGQNFLVHRPTIDHIAALVRSTHGPILEVGAGDGALTAALARLGRDLLAVEIDECRAAHLRRRFPGVVVRADDALRVRFARPVVVGNVPFHLTTPILRRLLHEPSWTDAVLVVQWEVARKRAGVGGSTVMTAQAAPWFTFALDSRVPAHAFRPVPSVDAGILTIRRRVDPLVEVEARRDYEAFVRGVFTGRGRGIRSILSRLPIRWTSSPDAAVRSAGLRPAALPRDVRPEQWAVIWHASRGTVATREPPDPAG